MPHCHIITLLRSLMLVDAATLPVDATVTCHMPLRYMLLHIRRTCWPLAAASYCHIATCHMPHATRYYCATCHMPHAATAIATRHASHMCRHYTCHIATCHISHYACHTLHATCITPHATCYVKRPPRCHMLLLPHRHMPCHYRHTQATLPPHAATCHMPHAG
jgi:hypothetical protein